MSELRESGTSWRKADADAIRRHHAPLFEAWKRDWGHRRRDRNEWIPGFRESLQSLLDQGYTIADIGVFVGISGERARQYVESYGLDRIAVSATMRRVWDDELMRFRPVTKEEHLAAEARRRRERQERREWERKRRCHCVREAIRDFATEHGRPPCIGELAARLFPTTPQPQTRVRQWLAGSAPGYSQISTRLLDRLYLDCGFIRPDGRTAGQQAAP